MGKPVTVYLYERCSTCRAAADWLRQQAIPFDERPIYTQPPSVAELRRMMAFQDGELRRLFNTSGLEYRALDLKTKLPTLSESDALALLASNGKLVKRPFLLADSFGLVGFKADAWAKAFGVA